VAGAAFEEANSARFPPLRPRNSIGTIRVVDFSRVLRGVSPQKHLANLKRLSALSAQQRLGTHVGRMASKFWYTCRNTPS
jgi:hypothetical protein